MKSIKFLSIFLLLIFISLSFVYAKNDYQTFEHFQFKIKILKNWKKKVAENYIKIYLKKSKNVYLKIKEASLKSKEKTYLKKLKVNKFSKIYQPKIKKEFKKLNPKFKSAKKSKVSNYKVIRLKFSLSQGELNVYYLTDKTLYHRIVILCQAQNCASYNKDFEKIIKSFRFVHDITPPIFAGAVSAQSTSTSSVTVSWNAASDNVSSANKIKYLIYQANQLEEQNFDSPTYTTLAGATSYQINNLPESTSYYFVVRAQDNAGNIDKNTEEVIATTKAVSNDEPTAASIQYVTYKSNGANVKGLMYRPSGLGPFPAIIFNHGGVTPVDPIISTSRVTGLSEGGKYVVLATAYRGDIGSEGTLSINLGDINDILAATEYLKSKSYVDSSRIGVFGESRGGANTLLVAERTSDFKAVVSWYPYTNLTTYCQYIGVDACLVLFGIGSSFDKFSPPFSTTLPTNYQHYLHIASAVNHADKLTMPLQNSHGTGDFIVPYSQSEELNAAMSGKQNYTFYSYDGADHGGSAVWSGEAILRRSEFFINYL